MTGGDLITIIWHAGRASHHDRIPMIAAGVAFFILLATFPGIGAVVSAYSIFADPGNGGLLVAALPSILPEQAAEIIARQTKRLAQEQGGLVHRPLLFSPFLNFIVLLWGTTKGMRSLFNALNIVRHVEERRGFIKMTALSLVFTFSFIAFFVFVVGIVFVMPAGLKAFGLGEVPSLILNLLRWSILLVVVGVALALVYRFGSPHEDLEWRWTTIGSGTAAVLWVLSSIAFEWVVSRFGGLDELYGPLSAMIAFMIWIWLSTIVVLFGAELDVVADRRTSCPQPPMAAR